VNIFEEATKKKYRFPSIVGPLSVEDLWDLDFQGLDVVYKKLNGSLKRVKEESLLEEEKEDKELLTRIAIVKHIFAAKKAELEERLKEKDKAEKRQRILELISRKQDAQDEEKSIDELKAMLDDL
jgi:hypothetical protein